MRLLNATTDCFEFFLDPTKRPPYAILSHRWGNEEVSYQDFLKANRGKIDLSQKAGYKKIRATARPALQDGLQYIWVDTCCIDKASSRELSEAINSMFQWYRNSVVCYAYLADVIPDTCTDPSAAKSSFRRSNWFTRGWTLQELLAPSNLLFFASDWSYIEDRSNLATCIQDITTIYTQYLDSSGQRYVNLSRATIAEKMSWAADRVTTREEDIAYSLLGLFGVNIPLIYGEAGQAFTRLQEEIIRRCFDPTLLAWNIHKDGQALYPQTTAPYPSPWWSTLKTLCGMAHPYLHGAKQIATTPSIVGLLAPSPAHFRGCGDIEFFEADLTVSLTSEGLNMILPVSRDRVPWLILPCYKRGDWSSRLAFPVIGPARGLWMRTDLPAEWVDAIKWKLWRQTPVVLSTTVIPESYIFGQSVGFHLLLNSLPENLELLQVYSDEKWQSGSNLERFQRLRYRQTLSSEKLLVAANVKEIVTGKHFSLIVEAHEKLASETYMISFIVGFLELQIPGACLLKSWGQTGTILRYGFITDASYDNISRRVLAEVVLQPALTTSVQIGKSKVSVRISPESTHERRLPEVIFAVHSSTGLSTLSQTVFFFLVNIKYPSEIILIFIPLLLIDLLSFPREVEQYIEDILFSLLPPDPSAVVYDLIDRATDFTSIIMLLLGLMPAFFWVIPQLSVHSRTFLVAWLLPFIPLTVSAPRGVVHCVLAIFWLRLDETPYLPNPSLPSSSLVDSILSDSYFRVLISSLIIFRQLTESAYEFTHGMIHMATFPLFAAYFSNLTAFFRSH